MKNNKTRNKILYFIIALLCLLLIGIIYIVTYHFAKDDANKLIALNTALTVFSIFSSTAIGIGAIYFSFLQIKVNSEQNKELFILKQRPLFVLDVDKSNFSNTLKPRFNKNTDQEHHKGSYFIFYGNNGIKFVKDYNLALNKVANLINRNIRLETLTLNIKNIRDCFAYNAYIGIYINGKQILIDDPLIYGYKDFANVIIVMDRNELKHEDKNGLYFTFQDGLSYVYREYFKFKDADSGTAIETTAVPERIKDQEDIFNNKAIDNYDSL